MTVIGLALLALSMAPRQPLEITKIDVAGTRRYGAAEVVKVSGLTVGQAIDVKELDAVAGKLAETGLFKDVRYRYRTAPGKIEVTFEIEEAVWDLPVVFDNFVWFKDAELVAEVARTVPSFDATTPSTGGVTDLIARALKQILMSRGLPGEVDYTTFQQLDGTGKKGLFTVVRPGVRICGFHVEGAAAVPEPELIALAESATSRDYSRSFMTDYAAKTLTQPYRRRGYWRASFDAPVATASSTGGCSGATVTMRVTEGPTYVWDRAEWIGNTALTSPELDRLVPLKGGDVADVSKLEAGLRQIGDAFGHRGYIRAQASSTPVLDDATKRVTFRITVDEGPQFHMGKLTVTGVSPSDAEALIKKWKLKPGDVYDADYLREFRAKEMGPLASRVGSIQLKANDAHVLDVTIVIQ